MQSNTLSPCALVLGLTATLPAQDLKPPKAPQNLQVPDGHSLSLKVYATGTQNYVCVPEGGTPTWKFLGPQATLFVAIPWAQHTVYAQIGTHFLSANPVEGGTARPTWQHSFDSSAVWGKAAASSTDPLYVAPGAIPWLLVQITGAQPGPAGGNAFGRTTFIQRVNTSGGVAPTTGCDEGSFGKVALMPYATDYYLYQAVKK